MNLADPELELIDPTPNIHNLFVHFDELFFFTKLAGRALVRWSKRMYSCAGVCSYEGRNGLCDIALSEPLLKLRPRKDLIQTLLHEMIHAFLFITKRDNDRDGHGPNFQFHMHRINKAAGLNITIYHDFHDEVKLYLKHWWRCNGKCQKMRPYFGVVRRSCNRAPGPYDTWWDSHKRICGGTFIKIKEPEKKQKVTKKNDKGKINAHITKYINNNNDSTANKNSTKDLGKENKIIKVPVAGRNTKVTGNILKTNSDRRTNSGSVIEKVRDVWQNKVLPTSVPVANSKVPPKPRKSINEPHTYKHKVDSPLDQSSVKKVKKIDDYFKSTASAILKDVYGDEFIITQSHDNTKLTAVTSIQDNFSNKTEQVKKTLDLVNCPSCNNKVSSKDINKHLDECLNKSIIEILSPESVQKAPTSNSVQSYEDKRTIKNMVEDISKKSSFKFETENNVLIKGSTQLNKSSSNIQNIPYNTKSNIQVSQFKTGSKRKSSDNPHDKQPKIFKEIVSMTKLVNANEMHAYIIPKTEKKPSDISRPSTSKDFDQVCPCCGKLLDIPIELHLNDCLGFVDNTTISVEGSSDLNFKSKTQIHTQPGTSKQSNTDVCSIETQDFQKCPCCGLKVDKPLELHLDECLGFFSNDETLPVEGASLIETIVIDDDDDEFDESQLLNATGTKSPCPCCLKMVEIGEMNDHLDICLGT